MPTQAQKHAQIPPPPRRLILTTFEHLVAFGFGSGLAPKAPGTFGTLAALPFAIGLLALPWPYYLAFCAVAFVFGSWVCDRSCKLLGVHDYPGLVFDEFVGLWVASIPLLWLPWGSSAFWLGLLAAFVLFRLFDIVKPWPIKLADRHVHGGFGVMLDDLIAGVIAAIPLALGLYLAALLGH